MRQIPWNDEMKPYLDALDGKFLFTNETGIFIYNFDIT